ncbi:hypothetical protein FBULB1_5887 [Fusarium bulbicola]|nr:hypothetical protein FBULB1_5887 [Fusarium bulbicola]
MADMRITGTCHSTEATNVIEGLVSETFVWAAGLHSSSQEGVDCTDRLWNLRTALLTPISSLCVSHVTRIPSPFENDFSDDNEYRTEGDENVDEDEEGRQCGDGHQLQPYPPTRWVQSDTVSVPTRKHERQQSIVPRNVERERSSLNRAT